MRRFIIGSVLCGLCVGAPIVARAQERVPADGSTAVGIDIGAFVPTADQLDSSLLMNVLYEYYVTPRWSLRTGFGWADPEFEGSGVDSLRQVPLRLDVNYNWERGRWHPFLGTGAGLYFMQFRRNGESFGDSETKFGLNTGGGVEYFLNRTVALKGEGRYHAVASTRGLEPSGVAMMGGLKAYF
jgi:opacity protein-like surface antigen